MANIFGEDEQKLQDAHWEKVRKASRDRAAKVSAARAKKSKPFHIQDGAFQYETNKQRAENYSPFIRKQERLPVDEISNHAATGETQTEKIIRVTSPTEQTQKQEAETQPQKPAQQRPQQKPAQRPIKRENAPVIDFGRLAEKGYLSEQRSNNPGENMPDPTAKSEEPPVRRGKDLLYSKARERNPEEQTEQIPIKEPVQKTKAPNYDDMWANASDDDKAAFAEFMAQRNK
jgi:hypothetical protein